MNILSSYTSIMMNRRGVLSSIGSMLILTLMWMFNFNPTMAQKAQIQPASNVKEPSILETYIVHVKLPERQVFSAPEDVTKRYQSFFPASAESSDEPTSRVVHSYRNVVSGFAARLSPEEVKAMEKVDGFVSARPQRVLQLHTTHSPRFLGLQKKSLGFWSRSDYGKGMIIGVLDTGITPDHPSFSDEGMPPPPAKWKGKCEFKGAACNNKLIGARNFVSGTTGPPVDEDGHGTHTSSTASGNFVENANVFGEANGTAVGIAPLSHLAIYRVCSESGCTEADILAAMDAAVEDGVDILSLSLGGGSTPFYQDSIAAGAFGAMKKGIFVSCSAGNEGPFHASLSNEAPWILTVGASTIDRSIRSTAVLGNREEYEGESLFQPSDFPSTLLPLFYAGTNQTDAANCVPGSLNTTDVKGKVVLCMRGAGIERIAKGQTVKDAGGAAMILMNQKQDGFSTIADAHVLPAAHVSYAAGVRIKEYIKSAATPKAAILFKGTIIGSKSAPMVTSFSSRGPSVASPGILKPDIIGPGVSILAAWDVSVENKTDTISTFNIISGTSMSCPHLSGVAALIKSSHPDWSPAAIKSAIMTTAYRRNLNGKPIFDERLRPANIFATGSGHVDPSKANSPGLIYDLKPDDYIPYLCGLNYTDKDIGLITSQTVNCSEVLIIPEAQLNYPSFSIALGSADQTYTRTVTNVGRANSTYESAVAAPPGVNVTLNPAALRFSEKKKEMTYQVTFSRLATIPNASFVQGILSWTSTDHRHTVSSPISVKFV
ncbi:hypothetical protein U1Q18_021318 [Sarracenia purpurea var. burkii]